MQQAKLFTLVSPTAPGKSDDDTVKTLETMLSDAKAGRLIGMACVAMYSERHYAVEITGETVRCPTFSRGMLTVLDDQLGDLIRRQ